MPEIFLLYEYPTLSGGERSMLATLEGVQDAGYTPTVLAPPTGPLADALLQRRIEVIPFVSHEADSTRRPQEPLRERLSGLLRRRRAKLLHANSLAMGRLSGPVVANLELPSIAHLRDIIKLSDQAVADLNCHTRLLAVSQSVREFHVAGGLSAEKIHVLHNGVDLKQFKPRDPTGYLHEELKLPAGTPLVGAIGQICLRKAQDVFVRAAAVVAEKSDAHFVLVGERFSQKEESQQFEAELHAAATGNLAPRLHFLGARDDVNRLLRELTLLAHPSRQEPLGRVLLEAAASGTPVVATDVGGTAEIFPPTSNSARLVPPDDPDALAAAILELLDDQPQRTGLAAAAWKRAEEAFNITDAVEGLVAHYRALA